MREPARSGRMDTMKGTRRTPRDGRCSPVEAGARVSIVVVDDETAMLENLRRILEKLGRPLAVFSSPLEARDFLEKNRVDVLVTDLKMPEVDGLELLSTAKKFDPDTAVILLTAYGTVETAVEALHGGAFDYICKPFSPSDLRDAVRRALRTVSRVPGRERREMSRGVPGLVGTSRSIREIHDAVCRVARHGRGSVLITGETGTGKDLVAWGVHALSGSKKGPYVVLDCGAIAPGLLENELFGHERGAFTGATSRTSGLLTAAEGGTLFLDEVGELPLPLQAKMLRVLETGEYRRVGGIQVLQSSARIAAATNRDLDQEVARGRFREDLLFRLRVFEIRLPPLRDRKEDIPLIARHLLEEIRRTSGDETRASLMPRTMDILMSHPWPGNVRELRNVLEVASVKSHGEAIFPYHLPQYLQPPECDGREEPRGEPLPGGYHQMKESLLSKFDRVYLQRTLDSHGGNVTRAARDLGVNRRTLQRLIKKHGLTK